MGRSCGFALLACWGNFRVSVMICGHRYTTFVVGAMTNCGVRSVNFCGFAIPFCG